MRLRQWTGLVVVTIVVGSVQLPTGMAGSPSSDVIVAEYSETGRVVRIHPDGSGEQSLGLAPDERLVDLAKAGHRALVLSQSGRIDVLDVVTGERRTLQPADAGESLGAWFDPDGQRALVVRDDGQDTRLTLYPVGGGVALELLPGQWPSNSYSLMAWAPDGTAVVIGGWTGYPARQTSWRLALDGSGRVELPSLVQLSPQPGGTMAVGIEDDAAGTRLVRYDAGLTTRSVLRELQGWGGRPVWAADGSAVAVQTAIREMTVLAPDGGVLNTLGDDPWEALPVGWESPALSNDGSALLVHGNASGTGAWSSDGIYAFDVGTGRYCQVTNIYDHLAVTSATFSPDGSYALLSNGWTTAFRWPVAAGAKPAPALPQGLAFRGWVTGPRTPPASQPCGALRDEFSGGLLVHVDKTATGRRLRVESSASFEACLANRSIKLQRRTASGWKRIAVKTTNQAGRTRFSVTRRGDYQLVVERVTREPFQCLAGRTRLRV